MYGSLFLSNFSFDEKSVPVHFPFLEGQGNQGFIT